jgi:hypothetical protein
VGPIVAGFGVAWYTAKQAQTSEAAASQQRKTELEKAEQQRKNELLRMRAILSKICSDGAILSIYSWSESKIAFEHLGQMTLAGKSAL